MTETPTAQRLDKWLVFARIVRTRAAAQKLVESGHVRVNRVKRRQASAPVRVGDVLTIALNRTVRVLEVAGMAERRGPFAEARTLYRDRMAPVPQLQDAPPGPPDRPDR